MAEPEEQQAEDHEGRQGGNHQDRPHDPGPQDRRQMALEGRLHVAQRADVEVRPQIPQAEQMERTARPPSQRVVHDGSDGHRQQNPTQRSENHPRSPKSQPSLAKLAVRGKMPLPGPAAAL